MPARSLPRTHPPTHAQGVEFWAINTDAQALAAHQALNKLQIGSDLTRGLGCGGNPELGRQAALESQDAIKKMVQVGASKLCNGRASLCIGGQRHAHARWVALAERSSVGCRSMRHPVCLMRTAPCHGAQLHRCSRQGKAAAAAMQGARRAT